jgi:hypothetical protein
MNQVNALLQLTSAYENGCLQSLVKLAKIKKLPNGKYRVLSMKGRNLGTYTSREKAKKRLQMVEMFKHMDKSEADDSSAIDLTEIDEFAYSAIMRKMREKGSPEQVRDFLKLFKQQFDKAVKGKMHKPEKIALQNTMIKFNKLHKVKLDPKMVKVAAVAELGNAEQVGKYLSDIVRFTLQRIPSEKRQHAIESLKHKFSVLSEGEIASKQLPESSALGQSITFVKHVLFNHDAKYIREVLNSLVKSL